MAWQIRTYSTGDADAAAWRGYYDGLPSKGVYHSPEYIGTLQGHLRDDAELFVYGDDENYVYYPYFRRRLDRLHMASVCDRDLAPYYDIISSWYYGGPLLRIADHGVRARLVRAFLGAFRGYCSDQKIVSEFVRYDPLIENHRDFLNLLDVVRNRSIVFVDLSQSEREIWNQLEGRCRTAIRKAQRAGVELSVSDGAGQINRFQEIYREEMARKSAPFHYLFDLGFFERLFSQLKGRAMLFSARMGNEILGSSLCLYEGKGTAHDFLMATKHASWGVQPNNIILYESILWSKGQGLKIYDLQGGRQGVYRFKKSFSGTEKPFFVSATIHDPEMYRYLTEKREAVYPLRDEFFPAYRVRDTN